MNCKEFILLFSFIFVSSLSSSQVNKNGDYEVRDLTQGIKLLEGWKYAPEDNPKYAFPDYDDSGWLKLKTNLELSEFIKNEFKGFGWFRLKLIVPDSLQNRVFCLQYIMTGAMELYNNGQLIKQEGIPAQNPKKEKQVNLELKPEFINLSTDTVLIAIRFSHKNASKFESREPFQIGISSAEKGIEKISEYIKVVYSMMIIFGFLFALCIVHTLLYIYYPKRKENLYYSIFVFSLNLIVIQFIVRHLSSNIFFVRYEELSSLVLIFFGFLTLQRFLYELFNVNLKIFRIIFFGCSVLILMCLLIFRNLGLAFFLFISILLIDIIRCIVIGYKKKSFGYIYVITGSLIFVFGFIYIIFSETFEFYNDNVLLFYILFTVFFLALPVSVSIMLARWTSETNRYLSIQLIKVKELSAQNLAQEQEKKYILENQKMELERLVIERTKEIYDKNEELKQQNEEINAQKEEITVQRDQLSIKNTNIEESITYAKRIQNAVLPNQAYIDEILPDNFILYKPRNVVSGDFYWVKQINQYIVIAIADCTGHGVPGAIMSMLGISLLNEIVQKREITQANSILNELRKQLKYSLKQTGREGGIEDGIDIALCTLDTKTNVLEYAGANNPLYLIQNEELTEYKADRMPIGFYPNEKPSFTNHQINLNQGNTIYLFSDGFIDQLGGEKGLKYSVSVFQKIILENHAKPMQIQKERLEFELQKWMKGYEQTDDILVMGVKV